MYTSNPKNSGLIVREHQGNLNDDTLRVIFILTLFAALSLAFSIFANDPEAAKQPAGSIDLIEDWHGNVARSSK
jgi:hypothetical protein